MAAITTLLPNQCYRVVREFTDYDGIRHPVGETWVFSGTNFLPYESGLTLHVSQHGLPQVYRLHSFRKRKRLLSSILPTTWWPVELLPGRGLPVRLLAQPVPIG